MESKSPGGEGETGYGFPVPENRFDQKLDMFKRTRWDPEVLDLGNRFYKEIEFKDTLGYPKKFPIGDIMQGG